MAGQLARAAPAGAPRMHLRVGGSASNGLYYVPQGVPGRGPGGSTCVTDASLAALDAFARAANLQVTLCLPYNERADLFSLGCVLWELFSRRALATVVLGGARAGGATGADLARVAELYAHRVARGFRPPIPADWPPRVRALVAACWAGSPAERPTAAAVAAELEAMLGDGTLAEWDARAGEEEDEVRRKKEGGGERQTAAPPRPHAPLIPFLFPPSLSHAGRLDGRGRVLRVFLK
jgi:hypothetical protein